MKLTLPNGVRIGSINDDYTGITAIVFDNGCVCGCDVRGGAPGTRETALLGSEKSNEHVDAIALCGGSAYGLSGATGVMRALKEEGKGFKVLDKIVPIVPAAVIFDLIYNDYHYPDEDMGYRAVKEASREAESGKIGAGKGATVGKILGKEACSPSGLGIGRVEVGGAEVIAVVVVNAFGDVRKDGKIVAGAKMGDKFIDTLDLIKNFSPDMMGANTTIGCIITDAKLTKLEANKLASIGHNGLARTICPVHTDLDGDTLFCASVGDKKVDLIRLQVACVEAVEAAILDAVKL